jgi:hypothetical protein
LQIIHPEERGELEHYLRDDVLKSRAEFDYEYRIIRLNDQQERWVHGLGKLLLDERGEVAQMAPQARRAGFSAVVAIGLTPDGVGTAGGAPLLVFASPPAVRRYGGRPQKKLSSIGVAG